MNRPALTLELKKSHIAHEGYLAHLVVGSERIFIDRYLPDIIAADDLHNTLASEFSKAGITLVEVLEDK